LRVAHTTLACVAALACTDGPAPRPPRDVAGLTVVAGDGQEAAVGTALPAPIVVHSVDSEGNPIQGARINFAVDPPPSGPHVVGSVTPGSAFTDANGLAIARWTLGTFGGGQSLSVTAGRPAEMVTTQAFARALPGTPVSMRSDANASPVAITAGDTAWVVVRAFDRYDNETWLTRSVTPLTWRVVDETIASLVRTEEASPGWLEYGPYQRAVLVGRGVGTTTLEVSSGGATTATLQLRVDLRVYAGPGHDLAFTAPTPDLKLGIYVLSADGSRVTLLTDGSEPAWSPDGQQMAFTRYDGPYPLSPRIYVMNADGSGLRLLTVGSRTGSLPAWSPDGQQISLVTNGSSDFDPAPRPPRIFVVNRDGSAGRAITPELSENRSTAGPDRLSWSTDGSVIAYGIQDPRPDVRNHPLVIANADGSGVRAFFVTATGDFPAREPSWSPDGRRIAFASVFDLVAPAGGPTTRGDIYTIDRSAVGLARVTRASDIFAADAWPAWSPDGQQVAFSRTQDSYATTVSDGRKGLFIVNADGSGLRRLRNGDHPAWRPTPP
jgi:Tol biopolymer transport system component